jgi:DNA-binding XRE family transcriptional regulator
MPDSHILITRDYTPLEIICQGKTMGLDKSTYKSSLLSFIEDDKIRITIVSRNFIRLFGAEVKRQRSTIGLRQEELANIVQHYGIPISQSYISRLEGGQRQEPNITLIITLAVILQISIDNLIHLALQTQEGDNEEERN